MDTEKKKKTAIRAPQECSHRVESSVWHGDSESDLEPVCASRRRFFINLGNMISAEGLDGCLFFFCLPLSLFLRLLPFCHPVFSLGKYVRLRCYMMGQGIHVVKWRTGAEMPPHGQEPFALRFALFFFLLT